VTISRHTGIALSDLENWHPRDLATLLDIFAEEAATRRRNEMGRSWVVPKRTR
jgi:hypothetical protein